MRMRTKSSTIVEEAVADDGQTHRTVSPFLSQILLAMQKLHQTLQLLSFFSKQRNKKLLRSKARKQRNITAMLRKFENTYAMKFA